MSQDYLPLATITLGSSGASVGFSNIPATYRDLILIIAGNASVTSEVQLRFNNDSGNNYSCIRGLGFTGGPYTDSFTNQSSTYAMSSIGTSQSTVIFQIMDYSSTDKHKTLVARSMIPVSDVVMGTARWANTAAINRITVLLSTGNYAAGTTFSLYGVIA
jgi:hypothetical protein